MDKNKSLSFFWLIILFVVGKGLYNQFDSENLRFEKPALSILYGIVVVAALYFVIKDLINRSK